MKQPRALKGKKLLIAVVGAATLNMVGCTSEGVVANLVALPSDASTPSDTGTSQQQDAAVDAGVTRDAGVTDR